MLAAAGLAAAIPQQQHPPRPAFAGAADAVPLYVTVTGADGRAITGLTRDAFAILEDGQPRETAVFAAGPQPIAATLLLDMNGPPVEVPWLRDAALGFLDALAPGDRVRLGTFGDEVFLSPRLTDDRGYLQWVLRDELWAASTSALWDAIDAALIAGAGPADRHSLVVLSNGFHAPPRRLMGRVGGSDVLERAERAGAVVFIVTFEGVSPDRQLHRLAERTGGRLLAIRDLSFAPDVFTEIVRELHAQYLLGFVPGRVDGDTHEIEVRVDRPGAAVRTRSRYRSGGAR